MSVYPVFEALDVTPILRLRPRPLREPRFVLDVHLGRLARLLRLLGFDSLWRNDITDDELVAISVGEKRLLLTRDRGLLKRAKVTRGSLRARDRQAAPDSRGPSPVRPVRLNRSLRQVPGMQWSTRAGGQGRGGTSPPAANTARLPRIPQVSGLRPGLLAGLTL